jgi:hypothetical protein
MPSLTPVRPTAPATGLHIAGAFSASTDPAAGDNACSFGQPLSREVEVVTKQMALSDGQWMEVDFFMPSTLGSFSAASAAGDNRPLVRAHRHSRSAGGAETGDWFATSGTIVVERSDNVGDPKKYGVVSGSLDVRLALAGGSQQITVRGTWGCVIEPLANGGS